MDGSDSESEFERFARRVLSKRKSDLPPPWREELYVSYFWEYSDIESLDASVGSDPEEYPSRSHISRRSIPTTSGQDASVNRIDTSEEESHYSLILDSETEEPNGTDTSEEESHYGLTILTLDGETEELNGTNTSEEESDYLTLDGETEEPNGTDTSEEESHYTFIADDKREVLNLQTWIRGAKSGMKSFLVALLDIADDFNLKPLDIFLKWMKWHITQLLMDLFAPLPPETPCKVAPFKRKKRTRLLFRELEEENEVVSTVTAAQAHHLNDDIHKSIEIYYKNVQSSSLFHYTCSHLVKNSSYNSKETRSENVKQCRSHKKRHVLPTVLSVYSLQSTPVCNILLKVSSSGADCEYANSSESAESFSGAYTSDESDCCEYQYGNRKFTRRLREPPVHRKEARLGRKAVFQDDASIDTESEPRTQVCYRKRKKKLYGLRPSCHKKIHNIIMRCISDDCDSSSLDESMWSSRSEKLCSLVPKHGQSSRTKRLSARTKSEKRRHAETDTSSSNSFISSTDFSINSDVDYQVTI